jgi:hypothetical protein
LSWGDTVRYADNDTVESKLLNNKLWNRLSSIQATGTGKALNNVMVG